MLSNRKDSGTGNKLALYWNKKAVPKEEYDKYWIMEIERLKAELKKEKVVNEAILVLADAMINSARKND